MRCVIGIDPGIGGAIAIVRGDTIDVHDMPTVEVRGKRHVSPPVLARLLSSVERQHVDAVVVEHVQGVQGTGATSAFSFGRSFGLVEGVVSGLGLPLTLVRPQLWTKALGVSRDKGARRQAVMNIWPLQAKLFARVKDDGRADAALLCVWYGRAGKSATTTTPPQ